MRGTLRCLVFGLAVAAIAAPALAADVNLNFYPLSGRWLDKNSWDPVENQIALGGTVDFGQPGWPIHIAFGLHVSVGLQDYSNGAVEQIAASVAEDCVGITKVWETKGRTRPFLSGGLSFVTATYEIDTVSQGSPDDNDSSVGGWIEGGVFWRLQPHFNFGLYGRYLGGTSITLFGVDGDADYWQLGPMIGWSWPPRSK